MDVILLVYEVVFCSIWIILYLSLMYVVRNIPSFDKFSVSAPQVWPKLSIIVPACNEGEHIEQAANSLIAQDYFELEIILVNDRSSDNTGEIIDRLAANSSRVKAVHIEILPENWLGKVHALNQGMQHASGDWVLITDADINYSPGVLRKAVSYVEDKNIDHLALMPGVNVNSFWLKVAITTFSLTFLLTTRAASVSKPNSKAVIGVGAFNLVRRKTFDKTPGFQWLRMETVDDMGVGLMMHNVGGQTHFLIADKALSLNWYENIPAMFRGLEKNLFGAGPGYNVLMLSFQILSMWLLLAVPFFAFTSDSILVLSLVSTIFFLYLVFSIFFVNEKQSETWSLLLFPVGLIMLTLMMIWAAYKCLKNDGIDWRGTHYTISELRAGQRVKF